MAAITRTQCPITVQDLEGNVRVGTPVSFTIRGGGAATWYDNEQGGSGQSSSVNTSSLGRVTKYFPPHRRGYRATIVDPVLGTFTEDFDAPLSALNEMESSSDYGFETRVSGDAFPRGAIEASGRHLWGSGSVSPDINLYRFASNQLRTDDTLIAADGLVTRTKAGAPLDSDFATTPPDGALAVDTSGHLLYFRSGGVWRTGGGGGGTYTNEEAQDAVGTILGLSSTIQFTYDDAVPSITAVVRAGSLDSTYISNFTEAVQDVVGLNAGSTGFMRAGAGISLAYDDALGTLTITNTGGGGGSYTDEMAQDAVGNILSDAGEIDFTYDDTTPSIIGSIKTTATPQVTKLGIGGSASLSPVLLIHRAGEVGSYGNSGSAAGPLTISNYTGQAIGYHDTGEAYIHMFRASGTAVGKGAHSFSSDSSGFAKKILSTGSQLRGAGRYFGGGWVMHSVQVEDQGGVQQRNITAITNTANATITCGAGHTYIVGEQVALYGVNPTAWNQVFKILAVNSGAGTIQIDNSAGLGAYVSGGVVRNAPSWQGLFVSVGPNINRTHLTGPWPAEASGVYPSINSDDVGGVAVRNHGTARATGAFGVLRSTSVTQANSEFGVAFANEAHVDYILQSTSNVTVGGDGYLGEAGAVIDCSEVTLTAGSHYMRMGNTHAIVARPQAGGTNVFRHLLSLSNVDDIRINDASTSTTMRNILVWGGGENASSTAGGTSKVFMITGGGGTTASDLLPELKIHSRHTTALGSRADFNMTAFNSAGVLNRFYIRHNPSSEEGWTIIGNSVNTTIAFAQNHGIRFQFTTDGHIQVASGVRMSLGAGTPSALLHLAAGTTAAGGIRFGETHIFRDAANQITIEGLVTPAGGIRPYNAATSIGRIQVVPAALDTSGGVQVATSGTRYIIGVFIPATTTLNGIAYNLGTTVGNGTTDRVIVTLHDSTGAVVATSTTTAGSEVLVSTTADDFQEVPFTAPYVAKGPGHYFVAIQFNNSTVTPRFATGNWGSRPLSSSAAGTFGAQGSITPPTTWGGAVTALVSYLY